MSGSWVMGCHWGVSEVERRVRLDIGAVCFLPAVCEPRRAIWQFIWPAGRDQPAHYTRAVMRTWGAAGLVDADQASFAHVA